MANFLTSFLMFLEQPKKCGRQHTTTMSSLIKKIPANDVSLSKPHPQVLSTPLSDLEQRIKLISSKIDEGKIKGGKKPAASVTKLLLFQLITIKNCCLSTLSQPNLQLQIQKI